MTQFCHIQHKRKVGEGGREEETEGGEKTERHRKRFNPHFLTCLSALLTSF